MPEHMNYEDQQRTRAADGDFIIADDVELTPQLLKDYQREHERINVPRYQRLKDAYMNRYDIFKYPPKAAWKPDNRLSVNFAKYIVDTFNGYFIGIPIKVTHPDDAVSDQYNFVDGYNNQDDGNAELSKMMDIYGHAFEMCFSDEEGEFCTKALAPTNTFMIYDDSILKRPRYAVRYIYDAKGAMHGSFSDADNITYFVDAGGDIRFTDIESHVFPDVPIIEYRLNEEKQGIFESVLNLINAFNKALSEKANDVDYYADAYLKILGADLDEETIRKMRDNRTINFSGDGTDRLVVDFLQKPDSDGTQENLIDRLQDLIFQTAMVANINDDTFGSSTSGISLQYKLQSMSNLAMTKERKFRKGMNRRLKYISAYPKYSIPADAWVKADVKFTRNIPANLADEADTAGKLAGITSRETQLSVLSCVDDIKKEMGRIEEEDMEAEDYMTQFPTERTVEVADDGELLG